MSGVLLLRALVTAGPLAAAAMSARQSKRAQQMKNQPHQGIPHGISVVVDVSNSSVVVKVEKSELAVLTVPGLVEDDEPDVPCVVVVVPGLAVVAVEAVDLVDALEEVAAEAVVLAVPCAAGVVNARTSSSTIFRYPTIATTAAIGKKALLAKHTLCRRLNAHS